MRVVQSVHKALRTCRRAAYPVKNWKAEAMDPYEAHLARTTDCGVCGQYNAGRRGQRLEGLTIKSTSLGAQYSMSGVCNCKSSKESQRQAVSLPCWSKSVVPWGPKELRTDNGTHFSQRTEVDHWCQKIWSNENLLSTIHSPSENGVVERTIGLVKKLDSKNANSRDWSTKAVEIGQALNTDVESVDPPLQQNSPTTILFTRVGRSSNEKTGKQTPKCHSVRDNECG
ncbi:hypothetical protein CRENBAI_026722 [Crenichthys baileyi]|uniref:Integrase catalytic domain-containing protein n=1 Tax=Crenichthys baileyi TaxID=28760 RepID=A0AAV9SFT1_9TELE